MKGKLEKLHYLFTQTQNPLAAVLDRLGLQRTPYRLALRDGTVIEFRPGRGDFAGFCDIAVHGDYFRSGQVVRPGDTVIDIGANIGCFTVEAARRAGPTGRVLAVEPEEHTFRQLVRNLEINRLSNVTAVRAAVGPSEGEVILHTNSIAIFSSLYTTVDGRTSGGTGQGVAMTTLAQLMQAYDIGHCHYLKLDCEGAEHDIVRSMSDETARMVDSITMEVHGVPGHETGALEERLRALGYVRVGNSRLPHYVRDGLRNHQ